MKVDIIRNMSDIKACADLYASVYKFDGLNVSVNKGITILKLKARRDFIRVVRDDSGEIIAWLLASEADIPWLDEKVFQQEYFASNTTKFNAVKCVKLLHDSMVSHAIENGFSLALSIGSHQDESCVFTRILEIHGWQREGYVAFKKLR